MAWETNYDSLAVRVYGTLINPLIWPLRPKGGAGRVLQINTSPCQDLQTIGNLCGKQPRPLH